MEFLIIAAVLAAAGGGVWYLSSRGKKKEREPLPPLRPPEREPSPPQPAVDPGTPPAPEPQPTPTPSPAPTPAPTPAPSPDPAPSPATLEDVFAAIEISCLGQEVPRLATSDARALEPVGVKLGRNALPFRFRVPIPFPAEERARLIDVMRRSSNWSMFAAGLEVVLIDYTETDEDRLGGALNFDLDEPVDFTAGYRHPMRIDPVWQPKQDRQANVVRYWIAFIDDEAMEVELRVPFEVLGPFHTEATNTVGEKYNPSEIQVLMDFGNLPNAIWACRVPLFPIGLGQG